MEHPQLPCTKSVVTKYNIGSLSSPPVSKPRQRETTWSQLSFPTKHHQKWTHEPNIEQWCIYHQWTLLHLCIKDVWRWNFAFWCQLNFPNPSTKYKVYPTEKSCAFIHWPVPVSKCHHYVQWCKEESDVKEAVVICHSCWLIIIHTLVTWFVFIITASSTFCI